MITDATFKLKMHKMHAFEAGVLIQTSIIILIN